MRRSKAVPCQECRNRHVKCDGNKPQCHRCERSGSSCVWQAVPSGFRHGSSARYDADFADDQPWVPVGHAEFQYVDETADIARHYSVDLGSSPLASGRRRSVSFTDHRTLTDPSVVSDTVESRSPNPYISVRPQTSQLLSFSPYPTQRSPGNHPSVSSASPSFSHSSHASLGSSDLVFQTESGLPHFDEHEACLMRYFVVQMAHWFDICDGERHFECTVPLRARTCPPLLYAIYTAAARHLSRIKKYYIGNQIQYGGKILPNLTPETALHYHNQCIAHFVSLSDHSREAQDENLLAAAVILRFYEEVDLPAMGEDTESGLRGIQVFLDAQAMLAARGSGLRHAAYWIALRQEILTAFSKQRTFRLPLGPCEPYRSFEPADDYVWADRLVIHCADVLQYCFGSEDESTPRDHFSSSTSTGVLHPLPASDMRVARYDELISFETLWAELGPASFRPIYTRDPDRSRGEVFPELWYLNNCHVAGLQHLELARILLTVYNPKLPRLGPGQRTAMRSVDRRVRSIILRLCGIALSNQHSPPGLVTASVAIGMCGDRFTDRIEQEALLGVLVKLEEEHAYPTYTMQRLLKAAWGWDSVDAVDTLPGT